MLIAHLDVVDAPREGWSEGLDPFQLTERDGFFYGRGVIDDKNAVAGLVANLIRLRAEGFIPDRDILVALTADEETGNANGVAWLLAERRELMDVAYCLNPDAGGGQIDNGKRARLTVQTTRFTCAGPAFRPSVFRGRSAMLPPIHTAQTSACQRLPSMTVSSSFTAS